MLRQIPTRVRALSELTADGLLAAALVLAGVLESAFAASGGHNRSLTAAAVAILLIPMAWRRRHTLTVIVVFAGALALAAHLDALFLNNLNTPFVAGLVLAYTIGRHETNRRMWLELAALAAAVASMGGSPGVGNVLWLAIILGCPTLAGRGIRGRVLLQREMREKARRLESEREVRAAQAVEDERVRIASELQAVVANGVSAMVVQAEAVPRLFGAGDAAAAQHALEVIEETGRDAMSEMRRLLGVLRRDGEGPALAPAPTLSRAGALVAKMEAEGLDANITVEGNQVPLPPGVDLAVARVLQEALSSATRAHGVSRAEVSIRYEGDNVLVRVRDDRAGSDGLDPDILRALRERVGLYGGVLRTASQQGTAGYEVEVRLPVGGPQ